MNPWLSLLSGIIAAFSPCVIVLIPILFYRFFKKDKSQLKQFFYLITGFIIMYIITSLLISKLFTSFIQNGIKIGLGLLFVVLGFLSLMDRINPLNFPLIKNTFLFGMIFALIVSINPCSLPYLSVIISLGSKGKIFLNLAFFGLGLIVPAILFAITGQKIINIAKKGAKLMHILNKLMSLILIISGIYLATTIKKVNHYDVYISAVFLVIVFLIIIKSFFLINRFKDIVKLKNILLIITLILIIFVAIWHCSNKVLEKPKHFNYDNSVFNESQTYEVCSYSDVKSCNVCMKCLKIFGIALVFGGLSIALSSLNLKTKKLK